MDSNIINEIILGDNLEVLRKIPSESIDLIYLDPPFFSKKNYKIDDRANFTQIAFIDKWKGGIIEYISWLYERVFEMHRVLKNTGSIYLHCDKHADSYLRVFIMDPIFGSKNFNSQIIWYRQKARKGSQHKKKSFGFSHDTIYLYTKSKKNIFNSQKITIPQEEMNKKFYKLDKNGRRFCTDNILSNKSFGVRKNLLYPYKGYTPNKEGWMVNKEKLTQMDKEGKIYWSKNERPYRKYFYDEYEGKDLSNVWADISIPGKNERVNYPTQKPEMLLYRIISTSSNKNDVILDPFIGSGTTAVIAKKLNRKWIGIDISKTAIEIANSRIINTKSSMKL